MKLRVLSGDEAQARAFAEHHGLNSPYAGVHAFGGTACMIARHFDDINGELFIMTMKRSHPTMGSSGLKLMFERQDIATLIQALENLRTAEAEWEESAQSR